jgi:6-phosphogluconolactonase (cycloisomerase 2 family)
MYVTHSADNAVSTYSISQGGGALTLLEQDPTGTFPQAIALTP